MWFLIIVFLVNWNEVYASALAHSVETLTKCFMCFRISKNVFITAVHKTILLTKTIARKYSPRSL